MVKLVQTLEMLPTCDLATQPMIQFHYAFALNRYTGGGFKLGKPFFASKKISLEWLELDSLLVFRIFTLFLLT